MTIKETQEDLIRRKIVMEQLQQGEFPSVALVNELLEKATEDRRMGLPRFTYREMVKGQASDTEGYNAMFSEAEDDLIVSFESTKKLNNRIMALANYYESNRIRVDRELKHIELRAETLHARSLSHVNRDVLSDNLNDFSMIEFKGNAQRNIPKTSAFIDLRHGEVHLDKAAQQTIRHDLSGENAGFRTLTAGAVVSNLSSPSNCLQDTVEDTWRSQIITSSPSVVVGQLNIVLKEAISITNVSIDIQTGKPVTVTLQLSTDGDNFVDYEKRRITSSYQWVFEKQKVIHIRFKMEKQEEDAVVGTDYFYNFGAKTVEARLEEYMPEGYLVSKPFPIHYHQAIDHISMGADDYIPPGTNIRYYVGMDYNSNVIEWQEIEKNRPIEMKMVQKYQLEIDSYTEGYSDMMYTNFGQNFYRISKLAYKPLAKSVGLLIGRHMWLKETLPANVVHPEDGTVYQTSVRDWIRSGSAQKEYMNTDNYQDSLTKETFQRYTTFVYMDSAMNYNCTIRVDEDASVAVMLNNNKVKSINTEYGLQLKVGWNKIEVLTYARKEAQEIILNLYLREISDRIYANNTSLTEVSLYDLLNNTSVRIHNRFAVDDDNNLIVNYNPRDMDIRRHGVEYSLVYNYSVSEMTQHQLRFMAILSKEDINTTTSPRLKDYKLIIE